jgi:hypothetical protein
MVTSTNPTFMAPNMIDMSNSSNNSTELTDSERLTYQKYLSLAEQIIERTNELIDVSNSIRTAAVAAKLHNAIKTMGYSDKYDRNFVYHAYHEMLEFFSMPISHRVGDVEQEQAVLGE